MCHSEKVAQACLGVFGLESLDPGLGGLNGSDFLLAFGLATVVSWTCLADVGAVHVPSLVGFLKGRPLPRGMSSRIESRACGGARVVQTKSQ